MLKTENCPDNLKVADITLVFKKKNPLHEVNYTPVRVLPGISKVFEKLMQKQISGYISNCLSPYLCVYRKGFSSQQAFLSLMKTGKKLLDKKCFGGAILMDLSQFEIDVLLCKFERLRLKVFSCYLRMFLIKTSMISDW